MKEERLHHILLIMPYGSVGGMERLAETFYNNYKKQGFQVKAVKIIGLENDIINFGDDEIILSRKDFAAYSPAQRLLFYAKIPFLLKNIIKRYNIDVSIAFGDMANCFSAITGTKEQKIASFHAVKSIEFKNAAGIGNFFKWSIRNTYKRFEKVVAISQAIKKDLIENCDYKFQNLKVIYNPHDALSIIKRAKEDFEEDEKKYIQNDYILFLGRLSIQKAPWHLIKSFYIIKDQFPNINLLMLGDGDSFIQKYCFDLVAYLNLNDRVFFLGRKTNPYKYLAKGRCLALSSYYEGTPNVIAEAMILNIPIVTTNCTDGISEMMVDRINEDKNGIILTDAGIITPNVLNGKEGMIPNDFEINAEDERYSEALKLILCEEINDDFRKTDKSRLLEKYDIKDVLKKYLQKNV